MSDEQFLAHSENDEGEYHSLREHLRAVQDLTLSYAVKEDQKPFLALAALLHDLGKYLPAFQEYLRDGGKRGSVPHARWGAFVARKFKYYEISYAVDGHHGGLPDQAVWAHEHTAMDADERKQVSQLFNTFCADTGLSDKTLPQPGRKDLAPLARDILTRFIFSCLVDADWLDTEAHFSPEKRRLRERKTLDMHAARKRLDQIFASFASVKEQGSTQNNTGCLNELRNSTRLQALQKASLPTGFFSLNLPTGLGKTLTSIRWAVEHAIANRLKRIIIVLPYVNIIDQTAKTLQDIFGEDMVLEHHSSYAPPKSTGNPSSPDEEKEQEDRRQLACENWDYEIIVTTSVQFYETLFSNRKEKCRKFHNIANSVVILDEVQTLNKDLVLPTLDMLQNVQTALNTSFVFCTATMPAFEMREGFPGVKAITPLVENAESLFKETIRVRFEQLAALRPISLATLKDALEASGVSTLAVLNTKISVRKLYNELRNSPRWSKVVYLTTNLCPRHRKKIIGEIRADLQNKEDSILVLSTQLVEAGVDFDFPCVFREMAPLESIIQAAGRCNREGAMPEPGRVVLFQLADANAPDRFYATQAAHVRTLLKSCTGDLYSYALFKDYYTQILSLYVTQRQAITSERERHNFVQVNDLYRIIPDTTRALFIYEYNEESRKLYDTIQAKERLKIKLSRDDYRAMQQYSVQVFDGFFKQSAGSWSEFSCGVRVWNGRYDKGGVGLDIGLQYTDPLVV